jgi:hypothetical protein
MRALLRRRERVEEVGGIAVVGTTGEVEARGGGDGLEEELGGVML